MASKFKDVLDGYGPSDLSGIVNTLGGRGRGGGVRRLAEMFAEETGKTVSSHQRAIQRALKSGRPPRDVPERAVRGVRANQFSQQVNRSTMIDLGRVQLEYRQGRQTGQLGGPDQPSSRDEGTRTPGRLIAGDQLREQLTRAADLYREGRDEAAHEAASNAVLNAYGSRTGRPDTMGGLGIRDFRDGIIPY